MRRTACLFGPAQVTRFTPFTREHPVGEVRMRRIEATAVDTLIARRVPVQADRIRAPIANRRRLCFVPGNFFDGRGARWRVWGENAQLKTKPPRFSYGLWLLSLQVGFGAMRTLQNMSAMALGSLVSQGVLISAYDELLKEPFVGRLAPVVKVIIRSGRRSLSSWPPWPGFNGCPCPGQDHGS